MKSAKVMLGPSLVVSMLAFAGCGALGDDDPYDRTEGLGPAGPTPLENAISSQDLPAVQRLLDHGVDPNVPPTLQSAAHEESGEIVRALIGAGAQVDGADRYEWTPLFGAAREGSPEVARVLLDAGADPCRETEITSPKNYAGMRPLDVAIESGNDRVVPLLEEASRSCDLQ